ncbi:MAG: AAA family ATPase [Lachnospiraceae bacterium]|nr:AAA family ATPase [Lachnospiraceae bacterium]
MLKRKIEKEITAWIESGDKALLVYGVRQAGKTFIIRECLKNAGCDYVEFNLIRQPEIVSVLESSDSVDDLILKLSLYGEKKITPGETYLFFDEIQRYKEVVTKIKFWVEDGRYQYILSGSLLGVEIVNLKSAPVGYLKSVTMYPLDFEEFIQIFEVSEAVLAHLKDCFLQRKPVDDLIHSKIMDMFYLYLIIGGMPAAVEKYRTSDDINAVIDEHQSVIEQYKLDFTQYEEENRRLVLTRIYDMIPAELNEKNKRFMVADIKKNLRFERVQDSFMWLWKAGVALPVFNVTEPSIPLMLNEKSSLFKLFLSDVGLLTTIYGRATKLKIINKESDLNKGAIYENVIAQELHAHGFPLYYYNSKRIGELDFVLESDGEILPVEVKRGKDYERHSALNKVVSLEGYTGRDAIVFTNQNVMRTDRILYLPVYMVMFLKDDDVEFADISIDQFKI